MKEVSQRKYNVTLRRVRELSPWRKNKHYIFVCVCVRARACVRERARVPGSVGVCMCERHILLSSVASGSTILFDSISQTLRFSEKSY